jgi:hypothetical protein
MELLTRDVMGRSLRAQPEIVAQGLEVVSGYLTADVTARRAYTGAIVD